MRFAKITEGLTGHSGLTGFNCIQTHIETAEFGDSAFSQAACFLPAKLSLCGSEPKKKHIQLLREQFMNTDRNLSSLAPLHLKTRTC